MTTLYQVYRINDRQGLEKVEGESFLCPEAAESRAAFLSATTPGSVFCYSSVTVEESALYEVLTINRYSGARDSLIDAVDRSFAEHLSQDARKRYPMPEYLGLTTEFGECDARPCWQGFDIAVVVMPE